MPSNKKPPTEVHNEPWTWDTTTDWTPNLFESALQEADTGYLESAADLCDSLMSDDRIGAVVNTRVNGLLGCELDFESSFARARKAIEKDWYRFADESSLREHLAWAIVLGVSIANTPFVEVDGRWVQKLHVWHMRNAAYDFTAGAWYVTDAQGKRIDIKDNDPEWWVYTPYGKSRPWGKGTWRQTALYWLGKTTAWRDWQHYNEVHGAGIMAGKLPEGKSITDPGAVAFWNQLKAIGKRARIIMPFGYELDTIEAKASTWETFPESIKHADTAIAIVHLGQNLTTEVNGGSYAATVEHGTVRQDYKRFDAQVLSTSAHDGPLSHWQRFNFGEGEAPWATWKTDPPEDLAAKVDTQIKGAQSAKAWAALGVAIDVKATAESLGVVIDPKAPPIEETSKGEIYKYHLDYGIFTINEVRASRGLAPIPGGDVPPVLVNVPGQGGAEQDEPAADESLHEAIALASGDTEGATGFRAGQAYADKLAAASRDAGAAALNPEIDAIMSIIEGLEDTPDWPVKLKQGLLKQYGNASRDEFASVVEKALVLAELAGRYSVKVDG